MAWGSLKSPHVIWLAKLKQDYGLNLIQNCLRDFWQWHHAAQRDILGRADYWLKYCLSPSLSLSPVCRQLVFWIKDRALYLLMLQFLFHPAHRAGLSKSFWTLCHPEYLPSAQICVICKLDERALRAGQMLNNYELIDWLIDTPKIKPPTQSMLGHNSEQ